MTMKSPSIFLTSKRLLVLLGGLYSLVPAATAYTTSSFAPHAKSQPARIPTSSTFPQQNSASDPTTASVPPLRRATYSLGLGKNQPVLVKGKESRNELLRHSRSSADTTADSSEQLPLKEEEEEETLKEVHQAVQYWDEHTAVRNIPSPYERLKVAEARSAAAEASSAVVSATGAFKKGPIVPDRLEEEELWIHQHGSVNENVPTMFGAASDFDLNTPWVEMLIHEQQQLKLA